MSAFRFDDLFGWPEAPIALVLLLAIGLVVTLTVRQARRDRVEEREAWSPGSRWRGGERGGSRPAGLFAEPEARDPRRPPWRDTWDRK